MKTLRGHIRNTIRCIKDFKYFVNTCCFIFDTQKGEEYPFHLWPEQVEVADTFERSRLVVALKARQLGWTWLALARILQKAVFNPGIHALLFSLRDLDAKQNLVRLDTMAKRLPKWMRPRTKGNAHELHFDNGSVAFAFPTTAGDSYTAAIALIDEADIVPNLGDLLRRVKPTIDNGGQLILVSRSNKDEPDSEFKRIYRAAKEGTNNYAAVFKPWSAHPKRDEQWYLEQKNDVLSRTGGLDDLWEQYPNNDVEALAARVLSKRIPHEWLNQCYEALPLQLDCPIPLLPCDIPGLRIWEWPDYTTRYVIGGDVAEGKETSDDSASVVLDEHGNQVAQLDGKIEPTVYAEYIIQLHRFYNDAYMMIERNNHGHAVIARIRDDENARAKLLRSKRDKNYGYLSDSRGKAELYSTCAETFRDRQTKVRAFSALTQLMSIERSTLLAPNGLLDDIADAYALATVGLRRMQMMEVGSIETF